MKREFRLLLNEKGQTLVWVAVGLVVLIGMLGLAIDVGSLYGERRHMQNAADAAALEAARARCFDRLDPGAAAQKGVDFATANYNRPRATSLTFTVVPRASNNWEFDATAEEGTPLYLAGIFGFAPVQVRAQAAAACGPATSVCGLWPVAFSLEKWNELYNGGAGCGKSFYLWADNNTTKDPNCDECQCDTDGDGRNDMVLDQGRAWLDFSGLVEPDPLYTDCSGAGCGTSELGCWIRNGNPARIRLPICVPGLTGVKVGVKDDVKARANDYVSVPLFDPTVSCTPRSGSCPGTPYQMTDFGCIKVDASPWDQQFELEWKDTSQTGKCWKGKVIKVSMACDGQCTTECGGTSGGGNPGTEPGAISLIPVNP